MTIDDYFDRHEALALEAIEATDAIGAADAASVADALNDVVRRADDVPLLLALAIAHAQDMGATVGNEEDVEADSPPFAPELEAERPPHLDGQDT